MRGWGIGRLASLLALLALVAAGCLGGGDGAGAGDGDAADVWGFEPILVGAGGDAETSVLVAPGGAVLACSHGGFGQPSPSWRSLDGGTTWTRMDPQPNPVVSGDCDLAALDDGTWAIVYDTVASATVAVSGDEGASWSFSYASAVPFGGVDRPWLATDGETLYMAYANVMAAQPAVNTLAVSRDGGRTWTEHHVAHTVRPEEPDRPNTVIGRPVVADGTLRIPLASADLQFGGPTYLSFAASRDGGQTWTEEPVAGPYGSMLHLPVADRAPDGTLFVTLPQSQGNTSSIDVLASRDDGATWTQLRVAEGVAFPSVSGPWLDARPDGTATLAWLHESPQGREVWAARVDATGVVRPARSLTAAVPDDSLFEFLMLDHDADGRAFIVYPMATGPQCAQDLPLAPGRARQCVWLLREAA